MNAIQVIGRIGRFVTGIIPSVMKLSEGLTLLMSLVTLKTGQKDAQALREAGMLGQELGHLFMQLGQEVFEFFVALVQVVDEDSDAGENISLTEIKKLADEGDDVIPVVTEISGKAGALVVKIRALF